MSARDSLVNRLSHARGLVLMLRDAMEQARTAETQAELDLQRFDAAAKAAVK